MKLSDYVVSFFEQQNVKDMFMVTGGGCMHLVNSFGSSKKIRYICTQHEQSAAMAAEAYAKYKNDLGVVVVTSGPGATNTITGLLGAFQDSIPCVFLSGQAKRKQTVYNSNIDGLRQFGVQEVNIIPIVQSITKYAVVVNEPEKIKYYLEKAVYLAKTGRPGPVWLDIPLDVQSAIIKEEILNGYPEFDKCCEKGGYFNAENGSRPSITTADMEWIEKQLIVSKRPVIIAGHGIRLADACEELKNFSEKYHIPVVTPIMGIDVLASDNCHNIGRIGTKGTRAGNFSMQNADCILAIGTRLSVSVVGHEYELFAREAVKIVIDIDEIEHSKKTIKIDRLVIADAKVALNQMISCKDIPDFRKWLDICNKWKEKYPVCLPVYEDDKDGINYYKFADVLTKKMTADMTLLSDAGSAFYVMAQAAQIKENQRFITSGAIATMGFGLPAAIGVAIAQENGNIISVTGDGSFQQNLQELSIMKYMNRPIKLFVMNNNGYLSIRQTQRKFFKGNLVGESPETKVPMPSTKKIAEAFELNYVSIENIAELEEKLPDILNCDEPVIIEVKLMKNQEIIPTNASKINIDGTMTSKPLEDMYPFLNRDEFKQNMIVNPVNWE